MKRLALILCFLIQPSAYAQNGFTVTGRVFDEGTGRPVTNTQVSLSGAGALTRGSVDSDGRFVFREVRAGTYNIEACCTSDYRFSTARIIVSDRDVIDANLPSKPYVHATGRIIVEGGVPMPDWRGIQITARTLNGRGSFGTAISPEGAFRLRTVEGEYRLEVSYPGPGVVKSITLGSTDLQKEPLRVGSAPSTQEIVITIGAK